MVEEEIVPKRKILLDIAGSGERGAILAQGNPDATVISLNLNFETKRAVTQQDLDNHTLLISNAERINLQSNSVCYVEINALLQSLPISDELRQKVTRGELNVADAQYEEAARSDRLTRYELILQEVYRVLETEGKIEILDGFFTPDNDFHIEGVPAIVEILRKIGYRDVEIIDYSEDQNSTERRTAFESRYFINGKAQIIRAYK
ncbi:hypothetical protein JW766_04475 [Candidatus Dojkabacteria bacterium]|nr:hypothetical protein [Candidatus Dojkabacteria bacterium]